MPWIGAVIAIAGAAASAANQHKQLVKQDKAAARGIRDQASLRDQQAKSLAERLAKLRESNPADEANKARTSYTDQLGQARRVAVAGLQANPGYSDDYNELAGATAGKEDQYAADLAGLMSRIDAPMAQRRNEGLDTANLGQSFEDVARNSQGAGHVTRQRIGAITANPWVAMLSQAAQGYGSGRMSGG